MSSWWINHSLLIFSKYYCTCIWWWCIGIHAITTTSNPQPFEWSIRDSLDKESNERIEHNEDEQLTRWYQDLLQTWSSYSWLHEVGFPFSTFWTTLHTVGLDSLIRYLIQLWSCVQQTTSRECLVNQQIHTNNEQEQAGNYLKARLRLQAVVQQLEVVEGELVLVQGLLLETKSIVIR